MTIADPGEQIVEEDGATPAGGAPAAVFPVSCDECDWSREYAQESTARLQLGRHKWAQHRPGNQVSQPTAPAAAASSSSSSSSGGKGKTAPSSPAEGISDAELYASLIELHICLQMAIAFKCDDCAAVLGTVAEKASQAWLRMAKHNPELRKSLETVARIPYLSLFLAYLPFFAAIRDHHITPAIERRRQAIAVRQRPPGAPTTNGREDPARARFEEAQGAPSAP